MPRDVHHIGARLEGEGDQAVRRIAFEPGSSLRDILNGSSARVRSACAGIGACGLCRVRIDQGLAGPATTAEALHLGNEALAACERLACQVVPNGDLDVTVLKPGRHTLWRTPRCRTFRPSYPLSPRGSATVPLGAAIDVGTSQITVAICDLASGARLAVRAGPNPQARLGADVIGRLDAAARSASTERQLRSWVVEAIGRALIELSQGEGIALSAVGSVRVVGNSAMLSLLGAGSPGALLDPANWVGPLPDSRRFAPELAEEWQLAPSAEVELVPPLGGFVGSDLLAAAVHCQLCESAAPALLVDVGTNSEIALWDAERLWASSAPGGPAFEATGVGCGVVAEPGAIHHLRRSAEGAWQAEVLDCGPPLGICGSGLVDLLAILRAGGEVDERGRPVREPLVIDVEGVRFTFGKADVDALQRAKAAVGAGIESLCRRGRLGFDQLGAVHVAGCFGEQLDIDSACGIGILPPVPSARVHLAGNAALEGALDLLLSDHAEAALARMRRAATLVNLSMEEEFEDLFLSHLHVRPMAARSIHGCSG